LIFLSVKEGLNLKDSKRERMKHLRTLCFVTFFIVYISKTFCQISHNELPYSITSALQEPTVYIDMPSFDIDSLIRNNNKTQVTGTKPIQFAKMFYTTINPEYSGEWTNTIMGRIWRIGIISRGAYSVYVTLKPFRLEKGVKLFIYSPGYSHFSGAIYDDNKSVLSIAPVPGDKIIIELNLPAGTSQYGEMEITKVYHDYLNILGQKENSNQKSLLVKDCFSNINYNQGMYWQAEKRAVCKIIAGSEMCTGTLIGNTNHDNTPYFITASHCVKDQQAAAEALFVFNLERPSNSSSEINEGQALSGASLVATTDHKIDFSLLLLNDVPPVSYRPYYAGWSNAEVPSGEGICIHHPLGSIKQIAIEYHPLITGDFGENFDTLSAWKVSHWEIGTTDVGSSGSPLFNSEHKIIGTLMGGQATCNNPSNDYFTKFSLSWTKYSNKENRLSDWLDPKITNATTIDGYDPYGFDIVNCDTTWNILNNEKLTLNTDEINWGWMTKKGDLTLNTKFAEKYYSGSSLQIFGVFFKIAKAYSSQQLSFIDVKVWNGEDLPVSEQYSKKIFIKNLKPNEVAFIGFDSIVKVYRNFFIGYSLNYANPSDSFALYHAENRGNTGSSTMYVFNREWHNLEEVTSPNYFTSLGIGITECYGKAYIPQTKGIIVFPIPTSDFLIIEPPGGYKISSIDCFDITGKWFKLHYHISSEKITAYFNIPSGLYFLKINSNRQAIYSKFIVINKK
jgi:lysyl endopeptidase